jgi:predicted Zn-dependent protease
VVAEAPPVPPPPPAVQRAEHVYAQHPHRLTAVMGLGTAYLNNGDAVDAAVVFHQAMTMAPSDPAPATMDALALSTSGKNLQAQARLRGVERAHPNYARAWLVDGLMPVSSAQARSHTIVALRHFLRLQPHNRVAPAVRAVLKRLENTK